MQIVKLSDAVDRRAVLNDEAFWQGSPPTLDAGGVWVRTGSDVSKTMLTRMGPGLRLPYIAAR